MAQEFFLRKIWGQMKAAYLEKLNDRQREAVEHGIGLPDGTIYGPLLIIAGSGTTIVDKTGEPASQPPLF